MHRMRFQLVKIRAMQAYQVRSLLYEFGVVTRQGFAALKAKAAAVRPGAGRLHLEHRPAGQPLRLRLPLERHRRTPP